MTVLGDAFQLPVVRECLSRSPLIYVDVGAAVGVEEPWLSMLESRELTRVVAFEPHPENFAQIGRLPNGTYHQLAIGLTPGPAKFYLDGTASSLLDRSVSSAEKSKSIDVHVETLENLRGLAKISSLDILKTDTECADFESISSAGGYLDTEALAIQCEFSMHGSGIERPFRDYDALLQPKGFLLLGLSVQRGALGEIYGGNFLYLMSIFHLIKHRPVDARTQDIKLLLVALAISHLDTAYIIARALGDAGVLTPAEVKAVLNCVTSWVYVPDTQSFSERRVNAASVLGNLTTVVAGGFSRAVSTPESNRLENYRRLVRKPSI